MTAAAFDGAGFARRGWLRLGPDPAIAAWAAAARRRLAAALAASDDWRAGGTWFPGVDALANDAAGGLDGTAFPWAALPLAPRPLHPAQLSVVRPGYPRPDADAAAHRWRLHRDGAHVDGLIATAGRRRIAEPHAWVLGLPLTAADAGAAPLVVWEGSHRLVAAALASALAGVPAPGIGGADITDAYVAARRTAFDVCPRRCLPAAPGEALLLHRMLVHGIAPWAPGAAAEPPGRAIAYLRPLMPDAAAWLACNDLADDPADDLADDLAGVLPRVVPAALPPA
jgi:hypothetical protein